MSDMASTLRVVLADDHDVVRCGIKGLLDRMPDVRVTGEAGTGEELLALVRKELPDLVITDISMPDMDGITAVERMHALYPELPILVLSMYDTRDVVKRALEAGARGYLVKSSAAAQLQDAVRAMVSRGAYFDSQVAMMLATHSEPASPDLLTRRQVEILKLLAQGRSSKEIAFELGLSSKTVDAHRARIMERLKLRDLPSLTLYALREGLIKP
jgi:DNA-binding NarL/FixJ family response regulator